MTTGYISGPMRKVGPPDFNHQVFCDVETAWRRENPDVRCHNPALNFGGDKTLDIATYLTLDLKQVLESDVIVLLPGWEDSDGATLECRVGLATSKRFEFAYFVPAPWDGGEWRFNELANWEVEAVVDGRSQDGAQSNGDTPRAQSLSRAMGYVCGDRNASYGPPTQDFKRTADMWNAFGFRFVMHEHAEPQPIVSHHIANAMILLKQSRLAWQPEKQDSWDDTAGYAACGHECVVEETKQASESSPFADWERELLAGDAP